MTAPIIAAVDPLQPGQAYDAMVLATRLAALLDAPLQAVHVFRPVKGDVGGQRVAHEQTLQAIIAGAGAEGEVNVQPGNSPARVLHRLSDLEHATCVVIGSGRSASKGSSSLGQVAEALLHGSRVPVIVVPSGYGSPVHPILRIAVAYGGTPESDAALAQARSLANAVGASVTVIAARDELAPRRLRHALASAPDVTSVVTDGGDPAAELAGRSSAYDLLVAGSRSYGPLRVVLLGAVTRRLLELAHCPVMIVPRLPDAAHEVALVGGMDATIAR